MRKMTFEPQHACPKRQRDGGDRSDRPSKLARREPLTGLRADAVAEVGRLAQAAEYRRVMRAVAGSFTDAEFRDCRLFSRCDAGARLCLRRSTHSLCKTTPVSGSAKTVSGPHSVGDWLV